MFKKVLLAGALLAPAVAYGGSPSTDLSVQIAPAASPTPPPPPPPPTGLTPPTEAQTAGLTTLAYNYDFSQSQYATESNWLDWTNTNPNVPWHNGSPGLGSNFPDGHIFQTTDPTYGQTVMDLQWLSSFDGQQTGNNSFLSIQTIMNGGGGNQSNDNGVTFPSNFYVEDVVRIDPEVVQSCGSSGSGCSGPDGVWTWQIGGSQEFDFDELYGSTVNGYGDAGAAGYTWTSGYPPGNMNVPSGWSPNTYHKYGSLMTTNGSAMYACSWIDDVFQSCVQPGVQDNPNWLIMWVGGSGVNATQLPTTNLYVQYIRVWTCANWQTTKCDGSTLNQSQVNGNKLSYYHQ